MSVVLPQCLHQNATCLKKKQLKSLCYAVSAMTQHKSGDMV
jgi:hypothetical protein